MNYAPFVWSTAIIFITTPTDNKVPRVAVCHLAGILWQMTSCLVYSQLSALFSCPQRITAAPRKSTNTLDVKLSFFLPVLSDNAARMTVTCFTTSFLVFKPAASLCIFLPSWLLLWEQTGQGAQNVVDKWPPASVFIAGGEKQRWPMRKRGIGQTKSLIWEAEVFI